MQSSTRPVGASLLRLSRHPFANASPLRAGSTVDTDPSAVPKSQQSTLFVCHNERDIEPSETGTS